MPRLSKVLERLEDRLEARWGSWYARHKGRLPGYPAYTGGVVFLWDAAQFFAPGDPSHLSCAGRGGWEHLGV